MTGLDIFLILVGITSHGAANEDHRLFGWRKV